VFHLFHGEAAAHAPRSTHDKYPATVRPIIAADAGSGVYRAPAGVDANVVDKTFSLAGSPPFELNDL
jgi:hypothetical protein